MAASSTASQARTKAAIEAQPARSRGAGEAAVRNEGDRRQRARRR